MKGWPCHFITQLLIGLTNKTHRFIITEPSPKCGRLFTLTFCRFALHFLIAPDIRFSRYALASTFLVVGHLICHVQPLSIRSDRTFHDVGTRSTILFGFAVDCMHTVSRTKLPKL